MSIGVFLILVGQGRCRIDLNAPNGGRRLDRTVQIAESESRTKQLLQSQIALDRYRIKSEDSAGFTCANP